MNIFSYVSVTIYNASMCSKPQAVRDRTAPQQSQTQGTQEKLAKLSHFALSNSKILSDIDKNNTTLGYSLLIFLYL